MSGTQRKRTQVFSDGKRQIDAVLVYKETNKSEYRNIFIENLQMKGLAIEQENSSFQSDVVFVKVHAPVTVLRKYAEQHSILVKYKQTTSLPEPKVLFNCMENILNNPHPDAGDPIYNRALETISKTKPSVFTNAERSAIVFSIAEYTRFGDKTFDIGLPHLLHQGIFNAAFALHDGDWEWPESDREPLNDRQLLAKFWANFKMWNKQQPLNTVQKYFGNEIAMYFSWLGFYNKMLLVASVMGVLFFIFGIVTANTVVVTPIKEACESEMYICPYCRTCTVKKLKDFCTYFYYAYINDNPGSVIFALLMSLWATVFMELWKREQATLSLRWNLSSDIDDRQRPEFQASAKGFREHKYIPELEQFVPMPEKIFKHTISVIVVILMILIVLGTILAIILYECALKIINVEKYLISITSSLLTLAVMMILRHFYGKIAVWLTKVEIPRTQLEFDKSYMLKMVLFSFVNNYGKLMYLAFFKGKFFTYPGDKKIRESTFPLSAEVCDPTGCVSEIFVLLSIIIIIKPIFSNIAEIMTPIIMVWKNKKKNMKEGVVVENLSSWERDYALNPTDRFSVMGEFEEMVMQYGFVTLLVAAFPLAPLCALINNIFEIRIDSSKMVKYYRRATPTRHSSFEIWFDTLQAMTYLAVITNALFITFTSSFIPQAVYYFEHEKNFVGFINYTLSEFKVEDDWWTNTNMTSCWYTGYRYHPGHPQQYGRTFTYFYVLSARLGFAILFAIVVLGLTGILAYAIPDIPKSIRDQLAYNAKKNREAS